jgi:hypothetical protein
MSCQQNSRPNHTTKIGKKYFQNVAKFKYLGMTQTNETLPQEELKQMKCGKCLLPFGLECLLPFGLERLTIWFRTFVTIWFRISLSL